MIQNDDIMIYILGFSKLISNYPMHKPGIFYEYKNNSKNAKYHITKQI